jgi:hypothetical protein
VLALMCLPSVSRADSPVRYALVIGNDQGRAPAGMPLEQLQHAEREARALRDALVQVGTFSESNERLVLLTGKGRNEILSAARRLAERHRNDRQRWGNVPTLFAFFFTGHGLDRQLLTADDPLTSDDLAAIFRDMNATFTFGLFDACFSGSLDFGSLRSKGVKVLPGFNPFQELPREILNSQGTMWVVSSRADEVSYEDRQLGGLLTHFFIEGLQKARSDEFGVSIDSIWEYASRQTRRYAGRLGRQQTPQKMVRELTSSGPVYLSLRRARDAELVFAPEVSGQFMVSYETGELSELVVKAPGERMRLPLFPGPMWIERVGEGKRERQRVELVSGGSVTVSLNDDWRGTGLPGREQIAHKGAMTDLMVVRDEPRSTGTLGLGCRAALGPDNGITPLYAADLLLRLDRDHLAVGLGLGRGWRAQSYPAWSYRAQRTDVAVFAGPAWNLGVLRLGAEVELRLGWADVRYGDGSRTEHRQWSGGANGALHVPLGRSLPVLFMARLGVALEQAVSAAATASTDGWSAVPSAGLGLSVRLD